MSTYQPTVQVLGTNLWQSEQFSAAVIRTDSAVKDLSIVAFQEVQPSFSSSEHTAFTTRTMGQYWRWICENGECISAHSFGNGLKYVEQLDSAMLCNALMLLKTDMSSLGHGGGDLRLDEDVHPALKPFVVAVIGRWFKKNADFVGDYTENKELELQNEDGSDKYKDISQDVAAAVWALEFSDWLFEHGKEAKAKFLEKNRERLHYMFGDNKALQPLFAAADNFEWSD